MKPFVTSELKIETRPADMREKHCVAIEVNGYSLLAVAVFVTNVGDHYPELPIGIDRSPPRCLRHIVTVDVGSFPSGCGRTRALQVKAEIDRIAAEVF